MINVDSHVYVHILENNNLDAIIEYSHAEDKEGLI